jgi:putative membrane protein
MHWGEWGFFGMHLFWWIFWIVALIGLFSLATPVPKGRARLSETALEILQRRYARGEIDTAEYEDRKARLTRDQPAA